MLLRPFDSFKVPGHGQYQEVIVCPMCLQRHSMSQRNNDGVKTTYCTRDHVDGVPYEFDTRQHDSKPISHLHRSCVRCGFEWLEEVAAAQEKISAPPDSGGLTKKGL